MLPTKTANSWTNNTRNKLKNYIRTLSKFKCMVKKSSLISKTKYSCYLNQCLLAGKNQKKLSKNVIVAKCPTLNWDAVIFAASQAASSAAKVKEHTPKLLSLIAKEKKVEFVGNVTVNSWCICSKRIESSLYWIGSRILKVWWQLTKWGFKKLKLSNAKFNIVKSRNWN